MKKNQSFKLVLFLLISFTLFSCGQKNDIHCIIKADVINRDSKAVLLVKASEDCRVRHIEIPIINNSFEYEMIISHPEAYELVFKEEHERGSFYMNTFIAEDGVVKFTLYPEEKEDENVILGGGLTTELNSYTQMQIDKFWTKIYLYQDTLEILEERVNPYSKDWITLMGKIDTAHNEAVKKKLFGEERYLKNTRKMYIPEARKIYMTIDSILEEMNIWEYNFIKDNISLISYYLFMRDLQVHSSACCWKEGDTVLMNSAMDIYKRLSAAFPDHPYTPLVKGLLDGLKNVHEGGLFIDFTAKDINGKEVSLSSVITSNRIVLLDLWSTWCSPCLKKSREMVPVYEKFKGQGFEIVGVARGYGYSENLINTVKKENYPWINLLDENNENHIWDKYSISHSGGGIFLITSSGKIISVNASPSKIEMKLEELLK